MLDKILGFAGKILDPIANTIDALHTSEAERLTLKVEMERARNALVSQMIETEARVIESQNKLASIEVVQDDKITRRWRPFVGYGLGATLIVNLALPPIVRIFEPAFEPATLDPTLLGIAASLLGVQTVSRSWEKVEAAKKKGGGS